MKQNLTSVNVEHVNQDGRPPDVTAILITMVTDAVSVNIKQSKTVVMNADSARSMSRRGGLL